MCSSPLSVAWLVEKGFYIIFLAGFLLLSFVLYTRGVNFNALFLCLPLYRRGSCTEWVLLQIHSNTRVNICVWILPSLLISAKIMRTLVHCAKFVMHSRQGRVGEYAEEKNKKIYKYCQRVWAATPTVRTHTHTHAYKMFNINICKFLEQRRRIKTHAWNSYKLLRSGGSRQRRGAWQWRKSSSSSASPAFGALEISTSSVCAELQLQLRKRRHVCAMDDAAAKFFFWGAARVERRERDGVVL